MTTLSRMERSWVMNASEAEVTISFRRDVSVGSVEAKSCNLLYKPSFDITQLEHKVCQWIGKEGF